MKWRPIIITLAALTVAGVGYAAYAYYRKEKSLLYQYKTSLAGFNIISKTKDLWKVDLIIRFTNMTDIEATLKQMYTDIYLNSTYVGFGSSDKATIIPARKVDPLTQQPIGGTADIIIHLEFSPSIVFGNGVDILLGTIASKDLPWKLKGYAKLSSGFVALSIPFDIDGTLADFL